MGRIRLCALVLASALLVSACGGDSEQSNREDKQQEETATLSEVPRSKDEIREILTTNYFWGQSDEVTELQEVLGITVDGLYGPETRAAHLAELEVHAISGVHVPTARTMPDLVGLEYFAARGVVSNTSGNYALEGRVLSEEQFLTSLDEEVDEFYARTRGGRIPDESSSWTVVEQHPPAGHELQDGEAICLGVLLTGSATKLRDPLVCLFEDFNENHKGDKLDVGQRIRPGGDADLLALNESDLGPDLIFVRRALEYATTGKAFDVYQFSLEITNNGHSEAHYVAGVTFELDQGQNSSNLPTDGSVLLWYCSAEPVQPNSAETVTFKLLPDTPESRPHLEWITRPEAVRLYPTFATWLNGAKVVRYNSASGPKRLSAFYWFQARTSLFKSYLEKDQRCRRPYTLWGENTDFSVHRDYESWLTLEGGKSK